MENRELFIAGLVGAAIASIGAGVYHKLWKQAFVAKTQAEFAKAAMEAWAEEEKENEE